MKKLTALFMAAAVLLMAGCGNDEKVIDGSGQNSNEGVSQSGGKEGTAQDGSGASGKGYAFVYNGTTVEVDADAAPIVEKLGEPASYYEAASCAFEGLDKIYTYNGFEINTYPSEDKDYVSAIVLRDDSVSTAEGICIGDTLEKVQEAYGQGTEKDGMIVYEKDGMSLCFIMKDTVSSIEYRSNVLQ